MSVSGVEIHLHGISQCDTVKRARAWLAERSAVVVFHDFKKGGAPGEDVLRAWLVAIGRERLLNRQGTTWRRLDAATQGAAFADDAQALGLMRAQPSVIKRPVVRWPDGSLSVGFDPAQWAQRMG
jgi:Spx/MgsR family transcriptional regulator